MAAEHKCKTPHHTLRSCIIAKAMVDHPAAVEMGKAIREATKLPDLAVGIAIGISYAEDGFPGLDKKQLDGLLAMAVAQHELEELTGKGWDGE